MNTIPLFSDAETAAASAPDDLMQVDGESAPRLLAPVGGAPVDGSAALFTWQALPAAATYRLQVAADPDFRQVCVDVSVGQAASLTLYESLPAFGTYYWRVQAVDAYGRTTWSRPEAFRGASEEEAHRALQARARSARAEERRPAPAITPAVPAAAIPSAMPADYGHTRSGEMAGLLLVMVLSFTLVVGLVFYLASNMGI